MNSGGFPIRFDPTQHRRISALSLAVLLYHVHRGAAHPSVGYEDAKKTLKQLTFNLNQQIIVKIEDLESALWSCNLMSEQKEFWHPSDINFDQFVAGLLPGERFDRDYNFIKEK